jgi:hypothetical protein
MTIPIRRKDDHGVMRWSPEYGEEQVSFDIGSKYQFGRTEYAYEHQHDNMTLHSNSFLEYLAPITIPFCNKSLLAYTSWLNA